ncbi:unnamed protein product, partial [Closterium sp. NIES-53]
TSPTLRWTGKVGDASAFRVWGSRVFVRDLSANKLSPRATPCVFLGFPPDAPGWQFYHPTSRRVLSSQDVTFDESMPYYRLFPYRTAPLPPPPLFLAPGPPPVDPLPPQGPAPSGVSQVDVVEPVEVAVDSGATTGAEPAGAGSGGAVPGGAEPAGAEPGGAASEGAEPGGTGSAGAEPGGAEPGGAEPGGAEPGGAGSARVASRGASSRRELLSPQELREWFARRWSRAAGAGDTTAAAGSGGARPGGAGAAGPSGTAEAAGVGPTGGSAGASGGTGVAGSPGTGAAGATGAGNARSVCAGGSAGAGPSEGAGVGAVGAGGAAGAGAAAGRTGAVPAGSGGATRPRPYFVPLLEQVLGLPPSSGPTPPLECPPPVQLQSPFQPVSPLPAPSPYTSPTGGLAERRAPASRPASPVRPARPSRRASRLRPPVVPGTHQMALRPSTAPLRVPLPSPPASSLPVLADPASDSLRAASPTVARLLATVVTDPSLESTAASALVAELVDFAARCRLDYAASLVAASTSVCPPSVGGECALSTDVLEDRQEEFQCFAAALPHLVSTLISPEGDPDAPDIPTPRSYAEAIEGPYSSQWQSAMDAEMASWKSTGTYVDKVPPPGANIVSGMWIFRVKRPPGSPPVFKARYVARGFSQRQGVDYFQTFSPTPKMTTLRVLLHVAAQRDYELHSLDFSTDFLQGSLHEEIWLRRPPGFTGSFPPGTQWSLRRPVYGLRQAPREWHDTLRTTLAALGFAPSTADPSLFLRTDTSLPRFYILVYVDDLVFATADTAGLAHVKSELQKRHTCTDLGELCSYLGLQITRDRAQRTITLTQSHMVQQVLQRFDFTYSSPHATPLSTRHSLSALPSDESVERSDRHLATFTRRPGSSLYTLTTASPPVTESGQVAASSQVVTVASRSGPESAPCSCRMASRVLVSGLPRSLPPLPPGPAPTYVPCVEGRQRAAPHSSEFPPLEAPLQTLHMDVWGPARVRGQGQERYFLLVVDDYSRYTTVFPLHNKGDVTEVLIDWIRAARLHLRESFGSDFPGIRQTFTLPASPQQNGSAERRIGMVMDVARPPPVDPLPPQGLAPSGVSQVDAVEPAEVAVDSGAARGAEPGGAEPGGAESRGAEPWGAESGGAEPGGAESGGAEPGGAEPGGAEPGGAEPGGASRAAGAGGTTVAAGPGGTRTGGIGAAGTGGATGAAGVGPTGSAAGAADGTGAAGPAGAGADGATGAGVAGGVGVDGSAGAGASEGAGVDAVGARGATGTGAATGGTGAVPAGSGSATRPRPYFVPLLEQVLGLPPSTGPAPPLASPQSLQSRSQLQPASPLPVSSPYTGPTGGPAERREPASRPALPVRAAHTSRRALRPRPPAVPGTHQMALRPSTAPLRVPLPSPPESSLPVPPDPVSDSLCAASPTVTRLLATVIKDPSFESTAASALVAELVDFAARCRLDYATSLVAASESVCPSSVGGECALSTDVLEDRQEEFQCFAAALPHLVSTLLAPEGDPDAPAIPTPRSYAEAIEGTYVDEVPAPGANIVSGMWIFRVKRPSGSPPVFKARYVARGFSQRQGVDYFQTFSPTPKMATLRVLLHVAAQRDYELHSLDFSTAFLQGSLHEEIWLRRPPGFTGSFPPGTQWSLRRPVYGLRQAPREWHDTLRTTLAALGFAHVKSELQKRHTCTDLGELRSYLGLQITRDRARCTITMTQSHMVQQVLQRFDFTYSSPQATPLSTRHSLSALPSDEFVEPSGPYPELVGCLMYLMTCTRPDLAYPLSILTRYVAPGRHRPEHMAAAKRVLRYLCSTSGLGLVLGGRSPVVLTSHVDASWVDDLATQRSSQGYTFSLGSGSVSWRSTRSSSVLSSSCEAEIYAGAMAAQELRWLTYLLTDLGEPPRSPPVLYVDNKAMLALCREHRLEHRTKHIALRYFLARELQQRGQLRLAYVASQANTADIFTKALHPCNHQRFCTMLACFALLDWSCDP